MLTLDIEQLRTFLAVEDTMSFTQAAQRVGRTQSAVSMQIKRLEDATGRALFHRLGRRIELSEHGERLLPHAREIVDASQRALAAMDDEALTGSVRLGITDDYAERFLPPIIAQFAEANPLVALEVRCGPTPDVAGLVHAGAVDVALVTHDEAGDGSRLVRRERLVWVTSERGTQHREDPVPLGVGTDCCVWRAGAVKALDRTGRGHRIVCSSSSGTVNIAAVLAGLTVSVFPESTVRAGMRVLGEADGFPALPDCQIGVMQRPGVRSRLADALIAHIVDSLETLPTGLTAGLAAHLDRDTMRTIREIAFTPSSRSGHAQPQGRARGGARGNG